MDEKTKKMQKKLIKDASEKAGSQAELARMLKMLPQNFNRFATGKRELSCSHYLAIKNFLEKS